MKYTPEDFEDLFLQWLKYADSIEKAKPMFGKLASERAQLLLDKWLKEAPSIVEVEIPHQFGTVWVDFGNEFIRYRRQAKLVCIEEIKK